MYSIKTEGLTKKYKNLTAVDNLNLTIEEGELFALLGVNGAGKTTTMKMLTCLTKPDGGDALVKGNSILTEAGEVKKVIGVSPQETAVAPNLSVKERERAAPKALYHAAHRRSAPVPQADEKGVKKHISEDRKEI